MILIRVKLTKQFDAQPLVECEKQLPLEKNKNWGKSCSIAYEFLCLRYKYKLRKYSHYVIFTFHVMNTFLSDSGTPSSREK